MFPCEADPSVVEVFSNTARTWFVGLVIADRDANGLLLVRFLDDEGRPREKASHPEDPRIAAFGTHIGHSLLPPGFEVVPSSSRHGDHSYLDSVERRKYGSRPLAWQAYLEKQLLGEDSASPSMPLPKSAMMPAPSAVTAPPSVVMTMPPAPTSSAVTKVPPAPADTTATPYGVAADGPYDRSGGYTDQHIDAEAPAGVVTAVAAELRARMEAASSVPNLVGGVAVPPPAVSVPLPQRVEGPIVWPRGATPPTMGVSGARGCSFEQDRH